MDPSAGDVVECSVPSLPAAYPESSTVLALLDIGFLGPGFLGRLHVTGGIVWVGVGRVHSLLGRCLCLPVVGGFKRIAFYARCSMDHSAGHVMDACASSCLVCIC